METVWQGLFYYTFRKRAMINRLVSQENMYSESRRGVKLRWIFQN